MGLVLFEMYTKQLLCIGCVSCGDYDRLTDKPVIQNID